MTITVNGATNTLTAASGLAIAGNTAVTGTLSATGITSVTDATDATSTTAASLKTAGGLAVAKKLYVGDNIVMASGKGIDFSATSDGSGTTTSEVLSDYEEGTWVPSDQSGAALSFSNTGGRYTKVGRLVTCAVQFQYPATADASQARISLPFTAAALDYAGGGVFTVCLPALGSAHPLVVGGQAYFLLSNVGAGVAYTNANATTVYFRGVISYSV